MNSLFEAVDAAADDAEVIGALVRFLTRGSGVTSGPKEFPGTERFELGESCADLFDEPVLGTLGVKASEFDVDFAQLVHQRVEVTACYSQFLSKHIFVVCRIFGIH
jgi:hypothetical protein